MSAKEELEGMAGVVTRWLDSHGMSGTEAKIVTIRVDWRYWRAFFRLTGREEYWNGGFELVGSSLEEHEINTYDSLLRNCGSLLLASSAEELELRWALLDPAEIKRWITDVTRYGWAARTKL